MRNTLHPCQRCLPMVWLLVATLSLVACGGSSNSENNGDSPVGVESEVTDNSNDQPELNDDDNEPAETSDGEETPELSSDDTTDAPDASSLSTVVEFDIMVPAYQSNRLQVVLTWGSFSVPASWVADESWTVTETFPSATQRSLTVMFFDDNGAVTLGSFETDFSASGAPTQTYQITADQFDTTIWDDDADGISNLDELLADSEAGQDDGTQGVEITDPSGPLLPVTASLELIADKTFRISWERSAIADYYRILENPDGISGYSYISDKLESSTDTFDHRVALHKRVNARYMVEACSADDCTLSLELLIEAIDGTLIPAIGYFKASNTGPHEFGSSVSLSADGKTMAIGARSEASSAVGINGNQNDDSAADAGAVYVFIYRNSVWQQQAYIKASNTESGDNFGAEVSLSADGKTLAVGAPGEKSAATGINGDQSDNSADGAGAAYVFVRTEDNWVQQAYIKASNTDRESIGFRDLFSANLTLNADGNTLVVGATGEDSNSTGINGEQTNNDGFYVGAVYVFERQNGIWQQQAYVKPADSESKFFGQSVSLSADGNTMAVGVNDFLTADSGEASSRGPDASYYYGAVYIYVRQGGIWEFQAFLRPDADWSDFGDEVSIAADGNTLAISGDSVVYLFERNDLSWRQQAVVEASNGERSFGWAISLSGDGSTLAVGASMEAAASSGLQGYQGLEIQKRLSGAAYVFTRPDGIWRQITYVKASNNTMESIRFGISISLSQTGDTLAIGASQEGSTATGINGNQNYEIFSRTGAVYLY